MRWRLTDSIAECGLGTVLRSSKILVPERVGKMLLLRSWKRARRRERRQREPKGAKQRAFRSMRRTTRSRRACKCRFGAGTNRPICAPVADVRLGIDGLGSWVVHQLRSDLRAQECARVTTLHITVSHTSSFMAPHKLYHVHTFSDERCFNAYDKPEPTAAFGSGIPCICCCSLNDTCWSARMKHPCS